MSPSKLNHREHGMSRRNPILRAGAFVLVVLAGIALAVAPALATENATSQKMLRQVGVMEKIIDKVLVDSPNVLVSGMGNTRGLYVEPFGVVFTFTASILRGDSPLARLSDWSFSTKEDQYDVTTDKDGNQVITIKKGKKEKAKQSEADAAADTEKDPEAAWQTERQRKYTLAKGELVQALLDYGETMSSLKTGQFVLIAGFLKDDDFFREEKISRFVLKAKVEDLRAFASGELTEDAMRSRVAIEEY